MPHGDGAAAEPLNSLPNSRYAARKPAFDSGPTRRAPEAARLARIRLHPRTPFPARNFLRLRATFRPRRNPHWLTVGGSGTTLRGPGTTGLVVARRDQALPTGAVLSRPPVSRLATYPACRPAGDPGMARNTLDVTGVGVAPNERFPCIRGDSRASGSAGKGCFAPWNGDCWQKGLGGHCAQPLPKTGRENCC